MSHIDSYYSRTTTDLSPIEALHSHLDTQVCVIGGGLAGISTALGLAERGISCVLLEAERVGWGASGRNGGFISCGFSKNPLALARKLGNAKARQLYDLTRQAYALIEQRIKGHESSIKEPGVGRITASWFNHEAGVRRYVEQMNQLFETNLAFWSQEQIRAAYLTDRYFDGYFQPQSMCLHSLNYAWHTAGLARVLGARIYEESRVEQVLQTAGKDHRWQIKTAHGCINAQHVVYACSAYINNLQAKLSAATLPVATYVLLTEPLGDRLYTAIRAPYGVADNRFSSNYYRVVDDKRLLWGGRVSMFQPSQIRLKAIMLNDLLSVYPQLRGIRGEVAWGGYMGYSSHRMPQLGQLRGGEWYCQGFGGHGMVTTTMGGELVAAGIAAEDDQYALFSDFGLDYVGKPFGPVIAQLAYWSFQLQDALQASWRNR